MRSRCYGDRGKSQFSRDLGIGPSTYDRYERDRIPPADILARAARLTGVRVEWLLTGEGPQQDSPAEDPPAVAAVVHHLRSLLHQRPELTGSIESFLELLTGSAEPTARAAPSPLVFTSGMIPIVGSTAAGMARFWEELETTSAGPEADARLEQVLDEYERTATASAGAIRMSGTTQPSQVSLIQLSRPEAGGFLEFLAGTKVREQHPQAVAWRIDGESMSPRYEDGDLVLTSAAAPAVPGHPCVARQRGQIGVNCKLFQQQDDEIILVPINEQFRIQRFPPAQLQWAYRVLYSVRLA